MPYTFWKALLIVKSKLFCNKQGGNRTEKRYIPYMKHGVRLCYNFFHLACFFLPVFKADELNFPSTFWNIS